MAATERYAELMGFDNLVIAEVTEDSAEQITFGAVERFAPAGEIKKSTPVEQASRSYDNQTYFIIKNEEDDSVELIVPILPLDMESKISGKDHDAATGALMDDGMPKTKYFAIGYRLLCSDNTYRYVWRLKGTFAKGDEEAKSKQGADSNNITYTYVGVQTIHKFEKTKKVGKAMVVDERDGLLDYEKWFDEVVTPDNIATLVKTA